MPDESEFTPHDAGALLYTDNAKEPLVPNPAWPTVDQTVQAPEPEVPREEVA